MKIVLDMNLFPSWVPFLIKAGHEAVHWSTVGDPGASYPLHCRCLVLLFSGMFQQPGQTVRTIVK